MTTRQQRRAAARKQKKQVFIGKDRREPARVCPVCRARLDAAFGLSVQDFVRETMKPGDVTLCVYCRAVLTLQRDDTLRLAEPGEFGRVDPDLQQVVADFDPHHPRGGKKVS
jgi:hypothetical protein